MVEKIRRSQVITTFGVGAISSLKEFSGVLKSPDVWHPKVIERLESEERIDDVRLAKLLRVQFFVMPPRSKKDVRLPYALFPRMLYCTTCRTLKEFKYWFSDPSEWRYELRCKCALKRKPSFTTKLLPSRFIVICPKGHMDDFPYEDWVHYYKACAKASESDYTPELEYHSIGGGASLEDIKIKCRRCRRTRSMTGALNDRNHGNFECNGNKPELFSDRPYRENCKTVAKHVKFVLRSASNVYFPMIYSSLLIPPYSSEVAERIQLSPEFKALQNQKLEGAPIFESNLNFYIQQWSNKFAMSAIQMREIVEHLLSPEVNEYDLERFKYDEFVAFKNPRGVTDLNFRNAAMPVDSLSQYGVDQLVQSKRLREVRVLSAFSRVKPYGADFIDPTDIQETSEVTTMSVARVSVAPNVGKKWLPGIEVFGEGILLSFGPEHMNQVELNASDRFRVLSRNMQSFAKESGFVLPAINGRLIGLHTLSHILIKKIAFETGYSLASLRERIYCNAKHASAGSVMNGILIYTADTDSEGTLGGLCRMANSQKLDKMIESALLESEWCSSDPVCRESQGQGMGSLNLAACHSCCHLPETCCEYGNRYLDRGIMDICFR